MKVARIARLNALGLTMARLDFLPNGFIPPHYHPRGIEILTVLEGSMEAVKSSKKRGVGAGNTVVLSAVNNQNAGIVEPAHGLFGAKPPINSDYLFDAFLLN
ncbi:hypothetical protein C2S52_023539 [Perilla frutescens var. hirtella]|nr:hypothetical protein C2S52_023539 [Perilla frutescens var. hirtella]